MKPTHLAFIGTCLVSPLPALAQDAACDAHWHSRTHSGELTMHSGEMCRLPLFTARHVIGELTYIERVIVTRQGLHVFAGIAGASVAFKAPREFKGADRLDIEIRSSTGRRQFRSRVAFAVNVL